MQSGGIILRRSMGSIEHMISYGPNGAVLTNQGFEYIGYEEGTIFSVSSLQLRGTGDMASEFTWNYNEGIAVSPGSANNGQFITTMQPIPPAPNTMIVDTWIDTNIWLICTGTNNWLPVPRYTDNLMSTNPWQTVPGYNSSYSSGLWTIWFNIMTNKFIRIDAEYP
jgi:hypothetical protein